MDLSDAGARAVLAAFDEAETLLSEALLCEGNADGGGSDGSAVDSAGGSGDSGDSQELLRVFDELVRRWQAQVPPLRASNP